jgi:hypothetical protein
MLTTLSTKETLASKDGSPLEKNTAYASAEPCEDPCTCVVTCVSDCCFPCAAFCCLPHKLCAKGLSYRLNDAWWKSTKIQLCHRMQSWLIRHPLAEGYCFCCLRPCISLHDVAAYGATMIRDFRKEIGPVWCDNMKVEVADPELVRLIMSSPQDGGPALGQAWLRPHKLPHSARGEPLFLLDLANGLDEAKPVESKRHADVRALIAKYLINKRALARQQRGDRVVERLLVPR